MVPPAQQFFAPFLVCILCAAATLFGQDFKPAPPSSWFDLQPGKIFFSDFALKPGKSKNINIASKTSLQVGFVTDLTDAQFDDGKGWEKRMPRLSDRNRATSIGSTYGGSSVFNPEDGVIALKFQNLTAYPIKVAIYTGTAVKGAGTPDPLLTYAPGPADLPDSPSVASMRKLGHQAGTGDTAAVDQIDQIREQLYKGIDYGRDEDRVRSNFRMMSAAFDEIALSIKTDDPADPAFKALLYATGKSDLADLTANAFGSAAARGHKPSLDVLINHGQHGILLSTAVFALEKPAENGNPQAVAFLVKVIDDTSAKALWMEASEGLVAAANQGNAEAKRALAKYAASQQAH